MPSQPSSTLSRIESSTTSTELGHLFKVVLLLSIFAIVAIVVRSLIALIIRGQRRMSDSESSQEKPSLPTPPALEKDPNQYLQSLKRETLRPDLGPIYPWIAPPAPLPGPYDAPYYPLPLPTIRRHSQDQPAIKTEEDAEDKLIEVPYARRVSTNSIPKHEVILEGSTTFSTQGWRRTHWTTSAG